MLYSEIIIIIIITSFSFFISIIILRSLDRAHDVFTSCYYSIFLLVIWADSRNVSSIFAFLLFSSCCCWWFFSRRKKWVLLTACNCRSLYDICNKIWIFTWLKWKWLCEIYVFMLYLHLRFQCTTILLGGYVIFFIILTIHSTWYSSEEH